MKPRSDKEREVFIKIRKNLGMTVEGFARVYADHPQFRALVEILINNEGTIPEVKK